MRKLYFLFKRFRDHNILNPLDWKITAIGVFFYSFRLHFSSLPKNADDLTCQQIEKKVRPLESRVIIKSVVENSIYFIDFTGMLDLIKLGGNLSNGVRKVLGYFESVVKEEPGLKEFRVLVFLFDELSFYDLETARLLNSYADKYRDICIEMISCGYTTRSKVILYFHNLFTSFGKKVFGYIPLESVFSITNMRDCLYYLFKKYKAGETKKKDLLTGGKLCKEVM